MPPWVPVEPEGRTIRTETGGAVSVTPFSEAVTESVAVPAVAPAVSVTEAPSVRFSVASPFESDQE